MPKYSKKSLSLLDQCHPDLQLIFKTVIEFYDCSILSSTIRTKEEQAQFVKEGKSKTMNSKHLKVYFPSLGASYSRAVDATPYPVDFDNIKEHHYFAGLVMATADHLYKEGKITHKLIWGGTFKTLKDYVHFEME